MAIYGEEKGGGDFKPVPQGSHAAVCDMVVDLGLQETNFGTKHQIYIRWQIPGERVEYEFDGQQVNRPAVVGATYTLSMSEKSNLRPLLESWRGRKFTSEEIRKFDITSVAGKPCLIGITHNESGGKTYANVSSLMSLPVGMPIPQAEGEVIVYDGDNLQNFDKLRPWLQDKIKGQAQRREEPATGKQPAMELSDLDDDVPF